MSKSRRTWGNGLIGLSGLVLAGSAMAKLAGVPKVVAQLGAMGFGGERLTLIALLEILSAMLFVVRPTRAIGLLLVSAYMGGAVAAHVQHGEWPFQPGFVLALIWLGVWLRHPQSLWSLADHSTKTERPSASVTPERVAARARIEM